MPVERIRSVDPLLLPESSARFVSVERIGSVDPVLLPESSAWVLSVCPLSLSVDWTVIGTVLNILFLE